MKPTLELSRAKLKQLRHVAVVRVVVFGTRWQERVDRLKMHHLKRVATSAEPHCLNGSLDEV